MPIIAMVSDAVYPYHFGGKELRYHELATRLSEHAEVHIYTMNWWKGPGLLRKGPVTYHAVCKLRPMYVGNRRSILQAVAFALGCLRLLWHRFDVLEADHMPYLQIPVLRLVALLRRRRLVVTWHEVWGKAYWRQYLGAAGTAAWLVEWCVMRLPHHIVAASPQTANRLTNALGAKAHVTVAPNGIDLDVIRAVQPAGPTVDITAVGRLISHKRFDMLLRSVALLHADGYPVSCRIIGNGPDQAALAQLANELTLANSVEFRCDIRDQGELYGLLKASRVFASPSAREGFGIAVLEALACGLPVVTTSAPDNLAQHLVIKSSMSVVCDPSPQAFADSLKGLLLGTSSTLSHGAGAADPAEDWLETYKWDAVAEVVRGVLF